MSGCSSSNRGGALQSIPEREVLRSSMQSQVGGGAEPVQVFIRIRPESNVDDGGGGEGGGVRKSSQQGVSSQSQKLSLGRRPSLQTSVSLPPSALHAAAVSCVHVRDAFTLQIVAPGDSSSSVRKTSSAVDDKIFAFDRVFTEDSTQEAVYDSVSAHVQATVKGYNTTIFAYGSTGSGKSFTMTGNSTAPGIIPRAISEIFSIIQTTASQEQDVFFYVRLSYVELYNNSFRNLLEFASKELKDGKDSQSMPQKGASRDDQDDDTASLAQDQQQQQQQQGSSPSQTHTITNRGDKIEVRESAAAGVFLAGPNIRIPVTTAHEAFQLIARGNKARAVAATQCNDFSSRSHAILTLHVESRVLSSQAPEGSAKDTAAASELRLGKMHLVDLAGSERVKLSGAEGDTLIESQNINLSLSALGDVLSALSRNATILSQQEQPSGNGSKKASMLVPVPYRNSKLTHLLKDSLGGNSKTIMIATVRTLPEYYQQTAVSLMYAARAKKVRNKSLVNRNVVGDTGIQAITNEIERLRNRLDERSTEFVRLRDAQLRDAQENSVLKTKLTEMNRANEAEKRQLEAQLSNIIHSQAGQLATQTQKITVLQQSLQNELALSQNRIAEQEREIKWLKKALDESAVTANQPLEKLERMQKVVEALQEQAHYNKQQIAFSDNQIIDLKTDLENVSAELARCQDENRSILQDKDSTETAMQDAESKCASLEALLRDSKSDLDMLQERRLSDLEKAASHIQDLEKDRKSLREKLSSTVTSLEKQMASILEEAGNRIKQAESAATEAQAAALVGSQDCDLLRKGLVEARDSIEELQRSNKELSKDVKDLTRQLHEERKALAVSTVHCTSLESTVKELSDKIHQLDEACHTASESIITQKSDFEAELTAKALELTSLRKSSQDLQKKWEQDLAMLQKNADETLSRKLNEVEQILSKVRLDADEALLQKQKVADEAMEALRLEMSQEILNAQGSAREELAASVERERKLQDQLEVALKGVEEADANVLQAEEELASMRAHGVALEQEFSVKLSALVEKHQQELSSTREAAAQTLQLSEQGAEKKLRQAINDLETSWMGKIEAAEHEHMQSIKALREEFDEMREQDLEHLHTALRQDKSASIEALEAQFASSYQELKQAHQDELIRLEKQHLEQKESLELEHAASVETAAVQAAQQLAEVRRQAQEQADIQEQAMQDANSEHKQSVADIMAQMAQVIEAEKTSAQSALHLALEGERQELAEQHKLLLQSVQEQCTEDYEARVAALRAEAERELDAANLKIQDLKDQLAQTLQASESYKEAYEAQKALGEALQLQLSDERSQSVQGVASAQHFQAASKALEQQLETVRSQSIAVAEAHQLALAQLKLSHEEQLHEAETRHQEHLSVALKAQESATESTLRSEFKTALGELRAHHAADKAEIERQHAEQQALKEQQLSELQTELQALTVEVRRKVVEDAAEQKRIQDAHTKAIEAAERAAAQEQNRIVSAYKLELSDLSARRDAAETEAEEQRNQAQANRAALDQLKTRLASTEMASSEFQQRLEKDLAVLQTDKENLQQRLDTALAAQVAHAAERKQLEAAHDKMMTKFTEELTQAQERCTEILASSASRQGLEAKAIRDQRQEFDAILQSSLSERDAHYKQALKQLEDNLELDRQLMQGNQERAKARHEAELASQAAEHESALRRFELSARERLATELARTDERHAASQLAALEAASAKHRQEIAALRAETSNLEEQLQQAVAAARAKHEEFSSAQSKHRVEMESALESELRSLEGRHKAALLAAETSFQAREARLQALHAQQCKALEQESEAAVSAAVAEERAAAQQKLASAKEIHRVELDELQSRFDARFASDRRSLELQHAEALRSAVEESKASQNAEVATLEARLQEEKRKHADGVAKFTQEAEEDRATLELLHSKRLRSLEDEVAASREAAVQLKKKHALEVEELRSAMGSELREASEAAAQNRQAAYAETEERHTKAIAALRERLNNEHEEAVDKLDKERRTLEEKLRSALGEVEARRVEAEVALASLQVQATAMREKSAQQAQEVESLTQALDQLTKKRQLELAALQENAQGAAQVLVQAHEQQLRELQERHSETLRLQRAKEQEQMVAMAAIEAELAAVRAAAAQSQQVANASMEEREAKLSAALAQEQSERAEAIATAERARQALEEQVATLREGQRALTKENSFLQTKLRDLEGAFQELEGLDDAAATRQAEAHSQALAQLREQMQAQLQEQAEAHAQVQAQLADSFASLENTQQALAAAEGKCAALQGEKEAAQDALGSQQSHLQGDYLALLQKQTDSLLAVVEAKNQQQSLPQIEEMEGRFLALVKNLPQLWKQAYGAEGDVMSAALGGDLSMAGSGGSLQPFPSFAQAPVAPASASASGARGRVPLHLLVGGQEGGVAAAPGATAGRDRAAGMGSSGTGISGSVGSAGGGGGGGSSSQYDNRPPLPWSSPTLRSSPTDQLVAAILDGDVQGVRAVVRSKGEDLNSPFWKELSRSVLPLHRAVSGLHFHGSERLLVATIEALTQLGADINATDQAGSTVLHKAIQVCTSKSVGGVVQTLLARGAHASAKNRNGDSALHLECDRLRSASVDIIAQLIKAGASPSARNSSGSSGSSKTPLSPLTLVLLRGSKMATGGAGAGASDLLDSSMAAGKAGGSENVDPGEDERTRMSGRGVWIRAAEVLVSAGAPWDGKWRSPTGATQLHLLLQGFPAPPQHAAAYRALLASALQAGLGPLVPDLRGASPLLVLCERMGGVSADSCPDAARLMRLLLDATTNPTASASGAGAGAGAAALPQELVSAVDALPQTSGVKSCLAVVRPMLATAGASSLSLSVSSGRSLGLGLGAGVRGGAR